MKLRYYVPTEGGLIEYVSRMEADGAVLAEKQAKKGTYPENITLDSVLYVHNGEVVSTLKSGEQLQVRLYFSEALQAYLDTASEPLHTLEAISRTYFEFYGAANMKLATLEIYAGDTQVTVNGETVNCSALIHGDLPIVETIKE